MSKTHFKKLRNPNYLGSWDLMDEEGKVQNAILTIADTKKELVFDGNGQKEECVVLYFKEKKPMVMNATNLKAVSKVLESPFIEDWVGKSVELMVKKVKAFGEMHDALRISPIKPQVNKVKPQFTTENFEKAKNAGATIETIKSRYEISPEIEKQYLEYVGEKAS